MSEAFSRFTADDVRTLIAQRPLAWVCASGVDGPQASQLPLIGAYDRDGGLVALIGHLARANPLHACLRDSNEAMFLFDGPAAYVSPEHAGLRDWAPTWNYANLRIACRVTVDEDLTDPSIDVLVSAMEAGRAHPWTRDAIAHRYAGMARAIIGFRAEVVSIAGRFKYGQDESDAVYRNILRRLPDAEVTAWMRRCNPGR